MSYKTGVDRKQQLLFPATVDEYVGAEHICRLIHAFTEQLDLISLGYKYAELKNTGCRPYDPRMMLNLYLYGYLHRVRSSRRLRDETNRNVEVMWLMEGLRPDDKTICNFRKDNAKALKETFRAFSMMCGETGLYGKKLTATDSVKIRANNSLDNNHNQTTVKNALGRLEKKITEYMKALEEGDKEASESTPCAAEIKEALERLRERKANYEGLQTRLESESEVSTVDADARLMRPGGDGRHLSVCYSVHTVVDSENYLIVDFEVSNRANDAGHLKPVLDKAKEIMEVQTLTNLADAGYYYSEDIVACERSGVTCLVAKPPEGGARKAEGFRRGDFVYNSEKDLYVCPRGRELEFKGVKKHVSGREYRTYRTPKACGSCEKKPLCTTRKYREVERLTCQDILDKVDQRTRSGKALYRKRQEIVEHCFGTIKAVWGYRQFLCRGKAKVTAEMALAYTAYNLRRVFNILTRSGSRLSLALG